MKTADHPIATIAPAYKCDAEWNPSLRWQIRCASPAFNGTLFETRAKAAHAISQLRRCPRCAAVARVGSPHLTACPSKQGGAA